ncbi:Calx-beta domain-containing protein [Luteolibacter marinus]|uniref:Calx-beta domain-containing protein n=1 Tax=Luteolibacter marinus TaxID=2776705 RepID=UPI0018665B72|nr:Calx-beta domain-containing protein [Luteolibacter marinus]
MHLTSRSLLAASLLLSTLHAAPDTVDTAFAASAGQAFDATQYGGVASVIVQSDGKVIFGSNEMPGTAGGSSFNTSLIRFNPDGSLDTTFSADNDPNGSGLGIYYDGAGWPEIHALGLDSTGRIIVAGVLQGMRDGTNSLASNSIVRLNPDGTLDTTFVTAGTTAGGGFNFIEDVTVQPDDKVIACGGFSGIRDGAGLPAVTRHGIARFNVDGTLDTGFAINPADFAVPAGVPNLSGFFRQAALDASGNLYVVGEFDWGTSYPRTTLPVFARLFPDGTRDTSFNPTVNGTVASYSGCVVEPSGSVTLLAYRDIYQTQSFMARFHADGSPDASFALDASLGRITSRPLQRDPNGKFLIATNNAGSQDRLLRLNNDGSLDPTFSADSSFVAGPQGAGLGYFGTFTTAASGKIYAGSFFDTVNGVSTKKLVAFEGDTVPNAPGTLQFAAHAYSATEQSGVARISITRTGGSTGVATATFSTSNFTTTNADFTPTTVTVTFPAGVGGTKIVEVPVTADALVEDPEVANLSLTNITGAGAGTLTSAYLTILDSNSPPQIILQPLALFVPPTNSFVLAVGVLPGATPVTYQWFRNGTPVAGATSPLLFVASADPALHNGDYTVQVTNPNGTTTSAVAPVTVKNPAVLAFTSPTATAVESDGTLTLTLRRSGSDVGAVSVDVSLVDGTANSPADYTSSITTVSWAHGDTADKTVSIPLVNDTAVESPESFQAVLGNFSLDAISGTPSSVAITLLDDDSGPAITTPLASIRAVTGWNAGFTVGVQSQTAVTYQWFKDGVLVPGESGATLSFAPVTLADFGYYSVEATNSAGTVTSGPVELGARPNPLDRVALDLTVSSNQFSGIRQRPDGTYLIFGAFTSVPTSGSTLSIGRLIRTLPDGTVDPTFNLAPSSTVSDALELPDGSLILAGGFTQLGVVPVPGPLTRVLADGNIDSDFAANLPSGIGNLRDLDLGPDGKIYLTHANGIDRLNFDGTFDAAFRANVIAPFEPFATYNKLEFGPGGELYLAGRVQLPGLGYRNLVKLNPDGSLDPTWKFTYGNSTFSNIGIQPDGKLIVPGSSSSQLIRLLPDGGTDASFTPISSVYNQTFGVAADGSIYTAFSSSSNTRLRRYLPNGTLDATFNGGSEVAANNTISSIAPLPDGSISIHGSFTTLNGVAASRPYLITAQKQGITITSQPLTQIADPGADVILQVVATSVTPLAYQWMKNGTPLAGKTLPSLQLDDVTAADTAGYSVEITAGSLSATSQVATLTVRDLPVVLVTPADRTLLLGSPLELAVNWVGLEPATFEWFRNGTPVPGQNTATLSIASPVAGDSGLYTLRITNSLGQITSQPVVVNLVPDPAALAAGYIPATGGSPQVQHIVPEPGGAYVFHEFSSITHPSGSYNAVLERISANGNIREPHTSAPNTNLQVVARHAATGDLYLGGYQLYVDGSGPYRVARTAADGTLDATYTANATAALDAINLRPYAIAFDADGRALVGGLNGLLVRLNTDGTLHLNFGTVVNSLSTLRQIRVLPGGNILVLGQNGMARLLPAGTLDPTFVFAALPGSSSYEYFELDPADHILLPRPDFADQPVFRLSPDGALLQTLNFPYATYNLVSRILVAPDGSILVAHNNGKRLFRLKPDGSPDPLFDIGVSGFNATISTLASAEDGSLWVGGSFTTLNGVNARGVVRLAGEPLDVIFSAQPAPKTVDAGQTSTFTVSASASGGASLSYLWRKNGIPLADGGDISGATTASLAIANSEDADEGSYDVIVTNLATGRPYLSNAAGLTVLREPELLALSPAQSLEVGGVLNLSVSARGAGSLGYQWLRNGTPIFGANAATFSISPVQESDSATYSVEISNAYGILTTVDIPVTVTLPAGGVRFTSPQLTFGSNVAAILPLPDGRTLVGGYFTNVIANSTNYNISELALLDAAGNLVTSFDLNPSSSVDALALMPDGGVLVGGNFTFIGGVSRARLARLKPDLTVDPDWNPGTGANSRVTAITAAPSGYYLGGLFTAYQGNTALGNVCRILPDGSPDPSFTPPALGAVYALQADGEGVLVGGTMSVANPVSATTQVGIVRLNSNGSHDTGFVSTMPFGTTVYSIAALPDGKWLAGGTSGRLQRFLADGSTDSSWNASANQTIRSIVVQRDGRIVIGGNFTTLASVSTNRIGRLMPNGSFDASFAQGAGADGEILTLAQDALGALHIGGNFNNYRSLQRGRYARLNGTPVSLGIAIQPVAQVVNPGATAQFSVVATATDTIGYQWRKNGVALANGGDISGANSATLTVADAGDADEASYDVVLTHYGDATTLTSAAAGLVVLGAPEILTAPSAVTTETGLAATFRVVARGVETLGYQWYRGGAPLTDGPGISGATTNELVLSDLAVADSGSIAVRVTNPLGFIDSTPVALLVEKLPAARDRSIVLPVSVNTTINDVIPFADGSYLIGGSFTSVSHTTGSASRRYLAKFNADGSLDANVPQVNGSGTVEILALAPDGKVYVGGSFTSLSTTGGTVTRNRIARLNSDLSLDTGFAAPGTGPNSTVKCILPLADGKVLIGGQFSTVDSAAGTAYVAMLNSNGSIDTGFTSLASTTVNDIAPAGDGTFWLSHANSYGGQQRIVRVTATGAIAAGFSYTSNLSSDRVSPQPDGTVLSLASYAIQKIETSGAIVSGWGGPGTYLGVSSPSAISTLGNGRIYLGGNFTSIYSGVTSFTRNRIAAFEADGTMIESFDPGDGFNGAPTRIRTDAAGRVWIVGNFTTFRGEDVPRIAVLNGLGTGSADPFETFVASLPANLRGEDDDADLDGFANLVEFLFGTDPGSENSTPAPLATGSVETGASLSLDPAKTYRVIEIETPKDTLGTTVDLEASQDLTFSGDASATEIGPRIDYGLTETRRYYLLPAIEDAPAMFWRMKVTR